MAIRKIQLTETLHIQTNASDGTICLVRTDSVTGKIVQHILMSRRVAAEIAQAICNDIGEPFAPSQAYSRTHYGKLCTMCMHGVHSSKCCKACKSCPHICKGNCVIVANS